MMEKVTLPKDVAEAIEYLRSFGKGNEFLISAAVGNTIGERSMTIFKFATGDEGDFEILLSALVNGYEVEVTPEGQVKEYFDALDCLSSKQAVKETLTFFGIKVDGIN
jgi:hypothetical protein